MGFIEILLILTGLIVLIIIGKALGRLFRRPKQQTIYKREDAQPVKSGGTTNINVDPAPVKKKKWGFPNAFNNTAQQNAQKASRDAQKAAQDAIKNFEAMRKRNDAIRKQTEETVRKMTKRSRGW